MYVNISRVQQGKYVVGRRKVPILGIPLAVRA